MDFIPNIGYNNPELLTEKIMFGFADYKLYFLDALEELGVPKDDIDEVSTNDIACKCPICGDSRWSKSKKRLHLYQKAEVINVNCFNGDCPAKNLAPWNFLKIYAPRTYLRYNEARRKFYLDEVISSKKEEREILIDTGFMDIQEIQETPDIRENLNPQNTPVSPEIQEAPDIQETQNTLEMFIAGFTKSNPENDLELLSTFLKENPSQLESFKELLNLK